MNFTDICIVVFFIMSMVLGFRDGFLKKVFGILGFWGGLIAATKFMTPLGDKFIQWFSFTEEASLVMAFCSIFILISLVANFSYRWFGQTGSESLNTASRIGGALLGAVQGLVAISLILIMFQLFGIPSDEAQDESLLYEQSLQVAPAVFDYSTQWIPGSKAFLDELQGKIKHLNTYR